MWVCDLLTKLSVVGIFPMLADINRYVSLSHDMKKVKIIGRDMEGDFTRW